MRTLRLLLAGAALAAALPAAAQDTTQRGVRVGLQYKPGTRPAVVVLPVPGPLGDSVRAIVQRDLDYGDRVDVIGQEGTTIADVARQQGNGAVNYALWKALGAAALVQATRAGGGVRVALHDVTAGRVLETRDFPLAGSPLSAEWRLALHGAVDEIERWITGVRGIAQSRILFVRGGRIFAIDSDGAGERGLTEGGALSPAWHPDGYHVAYYTFGERGSQIVLHNLRTGQARRLGTTPAGLNITPEFSPDGQWLVYAHGQENGTDLVITDSFGTEPARRITVGRGSDNIAPSFSPDGRRLAFTSNRSGHPEVYIADADGTNVELLTPFRFGDQSYRSDPAWSPNGRVIAFQAQIAGRFQIMTITLRDRTIKQLTSEGANEDPSWAPDGRHVVFTSTRTGTKQLFVLDTETGRARQLTHTAGARLAAWSTILDQRP
jgi:TolB protein